MTLMSIILYQFQMKIILKSADTQYCSTQINITDPFSCTAENEAFLNLDFGVFHEQFFHKLTSLTDVQKYDIVLKHKKPAENFVFPAEKNK